MLFWKGKKVSIQGITSMRWVGGGEVNEQGLCCQPIVCQLADTGFNRPSHISNMRFQCRVFSRVVPEIFPEGFESPVNSQVMLVL